MRTTNYNRSTAYGLYEEKLFKQAVEKYKKISCIKSSKEDDIHKHIDFYLGNGWKVDVKTHKRVNNSDKDVSNEYVWVELMNVRGNKGWIDGEATHIGFSLTTHYILVDRVKLRALVKSKIKSNRWTYKDSKPEPYKIYRRKGLEDKVVLVPIEDILRVKHYNLQRDNELEH